MGGLVYTPDAISQVPEERQDNSAAKPLTGIQLAAYLLWFSLPSITEAKIRDRSKTDGLAKARSMLQILPLVLSLIVHHTQALPCSQLEVLALGFAVCGIVTYAVYWCKPKGTSDSYSS